jgi:hypothetical protein
LKNKRHFFRARISKDSKETEIKLAKEVPVEINSFTCVKKSWLLEKN